MTHTSTLIIIITIIKVVYGEEIYVTNNKDSLNIHTYDGRVSVMIRKNMSLGFTAYAMNTTSEIQIDNVRVGRWSGVWLPVYDGYLFDIGDTVYSKTYQPMYESFTATTNQVIVRYSQNASVKFSDFVGLSFTFCASTGQSNSESLDPLDLSYPVTSLSMPLLSENEGLFGLGQRYVAANQRGRRIHMWAEDGSWSFLNMSFRLPKSDASYVPVPFLISNQSRSVLLNSTTYGVWDLTGSTPEIHVADTTVQLTVFLTETASDAVELFTRRRGRSLIPPRFTFAPWKQLCCNASDMELIDRMIDADVPFSLVQSYTHWFPTGSQVGHEAAMKAENEALAKLGLKRTTYFNGMVSKTWQDAYENLTRWEYFVMNATRQPYVFNYDGDPFIKSRRFEVSEIDFFNIEASNWYGSMMMQAVSVGYAGWMYDYGEYTPIDSELSDGHRGIYDHNRWIEAYDKSAYDALLSSLPHEPGFAPEVVPFTRSGFTRSGMYAWAHWTGDASATFSRISGLGAQITACLTIGLAGFPVCGSDIGGYVCVLSVPTPPELLERWLLFGAFSGIMRDEVTGSACEGKRAQIFTSNSTLAVWRKTAKLRTQLFPYSWKMALEIARNNAPLMRHHLLQFPHDPQAHGVEFQYMYGDVFLVAPIVNSEQYFQNVYLPDNGDEFTWMELSNAMTMEDSDGRYRIGAGKYFSGGQWVQNVPAPLESVPLFVRTGTGVYCVDPAVFTVNVASDDRIVSMDQRADIAHVWLFPDPKNGLATHAMDYNMSRQVTLSGNVIKVIDSRVVILQVALAQPVTSVFNVNSGSAVRSTTNWSDVADYAQRFDGNLWCYSDEVGDGTLWLRVSSTTNAVDAVFKIDF